MQKQLLLHFGDVQPFLEDLRFSPRQREHLLSILHDADRRQQLHMELAVTVDAGGPFVSKTYLLEGDGDIVVDAQNSSAGGGFCCCTELPKCDGHDGGTC